MLYTICIAIDKQVEYAVISANRVYLLLMLFCDRIRGIKFQAVRRLLYEETVSE